MENHLSRETGGGLSDFHYAHVFQTTDLIGDLTVLNKHGAEKFGVFMNQKQMNPSGLQSKIVVAMSENITHLAYY